ncbi:MAG TPA: MFS transporter [Holophagaceae bacterium]|nr:MFS transporter [Holophagaceae bacterium]
MNPWRGLEGLPREIWLLSGATLLNRMGTMALPFLVLYLSEGRGFTVARAGSALMVWGAGAAVAGPLGGRLADRLGHVFVMRTALLLSGLLLLLFPLARTWPQVVVMTGAWSLAGEAFRPASMAILTDLAPPDRRKAVYSLNRLVNNLGMSLGPALGGFLATRSYTAIFEVDGVTSILAGFALFSLRPPSRHAEAAPHGGVGGALRDARFLFFLASSLPVLLVAFQIMGAMPVHLVRNLGFSPAFYGSVFTLATLMVVFLEIRINLATAHWPHRRTLALGALLYSLGYGAMAFARTHGAILATVAVWTAGEMVIFPAMSDYVAHLAPAARRGEYMGLYTMTFSLAFCAAPGLGLRLLPAMGALPFWLAAGTTGLVSAALLARVRMRPPMEAA